MREKGRGRGGREGEGKRGSSTILCNAGEAACAEGKRRGGGRMEKKATLFGAPPREQGKRKKKRKKRGRTSLAPQKGGRDGGEEGSKRLLSVFTVMHARGEEKGEGGGGGSGRCPIRQLRFSCMENIGTRRGRKKKKGVGRRHPNSATAKANWGEKKKKKKGGNCQK